jgi:O-antigen/teichoic acid export membrane protein
MYETFLPLIPGILSLVVISLLGAYFAGKDLVRINLTGALMALIIIVIADLMLIPALQIQGAAIACSISYTSYLVYLLFWFSRKESATISNMFIITKSDLILFKNMLIGAK